MSLVEASSRGKAKTSSCRTLSSEILQTNGINCFAHHALQHPVSCQGVIGSTILPRVVLPAFLNPNYAQSLPMHPFRPTHHLQLAKTTKAAHSRVSPQHMEATHQGPPPWETRKGVHLFSYVRSGTIAPTTTTAASPAY